MLFNICDQGLAHWEALRDGADVPQRDRFDPIDIPALLPHIVFLDVIEEGADFRFRVIGDHVRQHFFGNYTGQRMGGLSHVDPDGPLLRSLRTAVKTRKPVRAPIDYVGPLRDIRKQDEVILPLADATGGISHILIYIEFKNSRVRAAQSA
jgi:hypothetical protein